MFVCVFVSVHPARKNKFNVIIGFHNKFCIDLFINSKIPVNLQCDFVDYKGIAI